MEVSFGGKCLLNLWLLVITKLLFSYCCYCVVILNFLFLIVDVNKWLQQAAHTGDQVPGEQKPQEKPQQQSDLLDLNTSITKYILLLKSNFHLLLGLRVQQIDLSQGDGDTTSLRSEALTDALSISSYQSELTPGHCIAMYSYQVNEDALSLFAVMQYPNIFPSFLVLIYESRQYPCNLS